LPGDLDALLRLSDLPAIAFVLDGSLRVVRLNAAAAAALAVDEGAELGAARAPFHDLVHVREGNVTAEPTRALVRDAFLGRELHVSTTALGDGTTLVLVHDASGAVDCALRDLAGGFVHELRNVSFGLMVMTDMLGEHLASHEALRHTRASIVRLAAATDTLQELARAPQDPPEELDVATIVDAAAERAWPPGSPRRLARTGASPCLAWGHPEALVRVVEVVLDDVASHAPKAVVIVAEVRRLEATAMVEVALRARGHDVPARDFRKIGWDALVTRREEKLRVGLGAARRWMGSQGGRLGAREVDGGVEMTIEIPAGRRA
jgi:hypothetical protein